MGQLSCSLCNAPVKNELMWNAHLMGRTHKESVGRLKERVETVGPHPANTAKRKGGEADNILLKKKAKVSEATEAKPKKSILKNSTSLLGQDYGSSSEEEDSDGDEKMETVTSGPQLPLSIPPPGAPDEFPSDFFDHQKKKEPDDADSGPKTMADILPEGFFDNPKEDAKVREIEYRDKMEVEWENFQKVMKSEKQVSEAIIEEEEEVTTAERNIDEIDDQLNRWTKVHNLAQKKEEIMVSKVENADDDTRVDSDMEEQEFDEFLNWRSKEAWK